MATSPNVLPLDDPPRQKSYRDAVANCIRKIKASEGLSNVELAEEIGCSAETISNAENKNNDLSGVTLLRLGYRFGEAAIGQVIALTRRSYVQPETRAERFRRLHAELDALEREEGR